MSPSSSSASASVSASALRLIFPLWTGGNLPEYHFGAEMLAWLAPETVAPTVRVPVTEPGTATETENGIRSRSQLNQDLDSAAALIRQHAPDRIAVLGGDCPADC